MRTRGRRTSYSDSGPSSFHTSAPRAAWRYRRRSAFGSLPVMDPAWAARTGPSRNTQSANACFVPADMGPWLQNFPSASSQLASPACPCWRPVEAASASVRPIGLPAGRRVHRRLPARSIDRAADPHDRLPERPRRQGRGEHRLHPHPAGRRRHPARPRVGRLGRQRHCPLHRPGWPGGRGWQQDGVLQGQRNPGRSHVARPRSRPISCRSSKRTRPSCRTSWLRPRRTSSPTPAPWPTPRRPPSPRVTPVHSPLHRS